MEDLSGADSTIVENRVLEVETRSASTVHSDILNTCSDKLEGGDNVVVGLGVVVVVEEEGILSSGMLNVMDSASLSLRSARLRLGMMEVLKTQCRWLYQLSRLI